MTDNIQKNVLTALDELYAVANTEEGDILVVGCSTSEVAGKKIGTGGNDGIAKDIYGAIAKFCAKKKLFLAAQCCEHLNRALVIEKKAMKAYSLCRVNAIPHSKAGGAFATAAYKNMKDPVLVEAVQADMGIDIGDTLIGMHLRPVAVPVRTSVTMIGEARLVLARSRCKYVGGERAAYDHDLG